ncbi:hypothetical protein Vadar_032021 [Vaccinium darrowii]|uniref:Uncharacterized protein n=1 Tax=Vaccinium darrowii TaxID=229202 RepID=A0ACB7Z8W4_9ERIC|nr:hypothetical protein Vadar_032021 [Vaccinium darrowii]
MASILPLKPFLILVCLSVLLPQHSVSTPSKETLTNLNHHQLHGLEIDKISTALSDKGYVAMSIILQSTLSSLLSSENTTTFTVFCPPDKAFFTPKYPQPPLTLIKYHIVPTNLDRESLESSLPYESKIDTLLHGHPLVVTTSPLRRHASINDVKVTEWDIYNDGRVIVHGVEDFFDPAFQTLLYPWYDSNNNKNRDNNKGIETMVSANSGSATSWVKDLVMEKNFVMLLAVVAFAGAVLSLGCFYRKNRRYSDYGYISTEV